MAASLIARVQAAALLEVERLHIALLERRWILGSPPCADALERRPSTRHRMPTTSRLRMCPRMAASLSRTKRITDTDDACESNHRAIATLYRTGGKTVRWRAWFPSSREAERCPASLRSDERVTLREVMRVGRRVEEGGVEAAARAVHEASSPRCALITGQRAWTQIPSEGRTKAGAPGY